MIARVLIIFMLLTNVICADSSPQKGEVLAKKLGLYAASKAIMQWERVFKNQRKMKRYKIDMLSPEEQESLKQYLIDHAIDSDHPTVAGA